VTRATVTRAYVDSSALVKRALDEPGRPELLVSLDEFVVDGALMFSSSLAWVEVSRSIRSRLDDESRRLVAEHIDAALSGVAEMPISPEVMSLARRLGPPSLRTLDAIHLATATLLDADVIVAYDYRLIESATELGFRTLSPG
jgi:uncharacterized protein